MDRKLILAIYHQILAVTAHSSHNAAVSTPEESPTKPAAAAPEKPRRRLLSPKARKRLKRVLLGFAIALPIVIGAMWYAANHVPWFGAFMADTLRSVIGTEAVADLEEFTYDLEDRWNRFWREGEKPKAYWESPSAAPSALPGGSVSSAPSAAPAPSGAAVALADAAPFHPRDAGPFDAKYAAPGDGLWTVVSLAGSPTGAPLLYKTLIHPDSKRPWAEVFAVAVDLRRAQVHVVAGTREPKGTAPGAREAQRTGLIPATDLPALFAGFNGGFKEEHGHYGMKVGGVLLIKPRPDACTIAMTDTGELRIAPWKAVQDVEPTFQWWRQTPACLVASGKLHPGLYDENTNWGAALGGGTVVRRSAIGLDAEGKTLFVAVSNHTSPRAMAVAMAHVGAVNVAQLDINYSYPRFVLFPPGETGQPDSVSLFDGFKVDRDDYVRDPSIRDFFYLVRR
jgi:hypothetical protein